MDSISAASGAPGLAQVYLLRQMMDMAQTRMSGMLEVLPPPAPVAPAAGRLDIYA